MPADPAVRVARAAFASRFALGNRLASSIDMNAGLYQGAAALSASERQLDVIAHNLANVDTVGYKRQGTSAKSFTVPGPHGNFTGITSETTVDWSQGPLERTANPYDLALFGDGFMILDTPDGEVYTRGGQFDVTSGGELVSGEGYPVSWITKAAPIDPAGFPVVIDAEGQAVQGDVLLGQMRLVDFADKGKLTQSPDGYWTAPAGAKQIAHEAKVHQGALERSNSIGLEEVVAMVMVQRSFEAASNVMSMITDSYQRLTQSGL